MNNWHKQKRVDEITERNIENLNLYFYRRKLANKQKYTPHKL